jgi:hypothetical protein
MTEFAPSVRTNTAIVLALVERSCSRGAIVRATRFHVPQLSSTRGSPRPLCRIRTSTLRSSYLRPLSRYCGGEAVKEMVEAERKAKVASNRSTTARGTDASLTASDSTSTR